MLEHSPADENGAPPRRRRARRTRDVPLSELVVLGLLAERPRHGYDIEREVTARRLRQWTPLGRSLLYHVLTRCQARGLLETESTPGQRGAAANVCSLTEAGWRHLRAALEEALSLEVLDAPRTQVGLMFCGVLGPETTLARLRERAARTRDALEQARRSRVASPPNEAMSAAAL